MVSDAVGSGIRPPAVVTGPLAEHAGGFRRFLPQQAYDTTGDSKHEFAWSRLQYTPLGGSFGGFGGYNRGASGSWSRDRSR